MKLSKQLDDLRQKKQEIIGAMKSAMEKVEEVSNDDAEYDVWSKNYEDLEKGLDDVEVEIKATEEKLADQIARAKKVEDLVAAQPEDKGNIMAAPEVHVKKFSKQLYAGDVEVRKLMAQVTGKKHGISAVEAAKHLFPNDNRIESVVRAPVGIPETTTVGIGDELVLQYDAQNELIELLRNELVYPKMTGMRVLPLPANRGSIRIPRTTGAISASWVEEGNSIPVGRPSFDSVTINPYKLGVITLATRELMERSDPAYETILRDQIVQGIAQAVDTTFISDLAGTAGSPAGLFDGLVPVAGAGTLPAAPTAAQAINFINQLKLAAIQNNMGSRNWAWVMSPSTMVGLMSLRSAIDTPLFPELAGGQLQGYPVVSTNNVPNAMPVSGDKIIALVDASELWFGLGSGISLATSDQAYIQSDNAPNTPPTGGVSLFQQEMTAIRGVLDTTWARRRDEAVLYAPTLL
jgi:HK97 family phage major capsid protein